jgi:hypothetical protein
MRNVLFLAPLLLIATPVFADGGGDATAKVDVCHKPGAHQKTLNISADALAAHLGHGDKKGACGAATQPKADDKSIHLPPAPQPQQQPKLDDKSVRQPGAASTPSK